MASGRARTPRERIPAERSAPPNKATGGAWIIAALSALCRQTGVAAGDFDVVQGTSAGAELAIRPSVPKVWQAAIGRARQATTTRRARALRSGMITLPSRW